ncbi:uncharacterized protein L203_100623 [Cryptococcus depauperatus CBS 7841]|uniref:Uncharacterized protein n=1 Tax=Cryptococcus depauperatus CBS 7841 TaxID=1295531 RepID=A0A1E3IX16_9TREE|nr:hypothetical protein L203_00408 [Cryptococcus depauperatus CBS 7841]
MSQSPIQKLPSIKLRISLRSAQHPASAVESTPATPTPTTNGRGKAKTNTTNATLVTTHGNVKRAKQSGSSAVSSSLRISLPPAGDPHLPKVEYATPAPPLTASPAKVFTPATTSRSHPDSAKPVSAKKASVGRRKSEGQRKSVGRRPSAIPQRLLSASATSTPTRSYTALPDVSNFQDFQTEEGSPHPVSAPLSPSEQATGTTTPLQPETEDTPGGTGKRTFRWARVKKPLREWLHKIMVEIRKKDDYALFEDPVDLEAFPNYLEVIGGEDKMMDISTMQAKFDHNEYSSVDHIENDLRTLVTAAQTFNPPGTIPHKSAGIILAHGLKHIERARPLVLTPPTSPSQSATPARGTSVISTREVTVAPEDRKARDNVHPSQYIPEEMLLYPSGSAAARAVGWNLNGGKRMYNKRISRAREKFAGKWRHWMMDGSRDIAEIEDIHVLFDFWRIRPGQEWGTVIDWKELRNQPNWWEVEMALPPLGSAAQQAPIPFNPAEPRLDKAPRYSLRPYDYGVYPTISSEISFIRSRLSSDVLRDEEDILMEHLRPALTRLKKSDAPAPSNLVNIYESPLRRTAGDWIREMSTGGPVGEAYLASLHSFVKGAMSSTENTQATRSESESKPIVAGQDTLPLDEYVANHYHSELLSSTTRSTIHSTLQLINDSSSRPPQYQFMAQAAYARIALRQLTSPNNPMDIKPLLTEESDFMYQGVGGKSGVKVGLEWMGAELNRLIEKQKIITNRETIREVTEIHAEQNEKGYLEKKRKHSGGQVTDKGYTKKAKVEEGTFASLYPIIPNEVTEEELKKVRLELVALSKFYPLPALKKMSKEEAARLLPQNVRGLMCRP